jgi:hypothetical protein
MHNAPHPHDPHHPMTSLPLRHARTLDELMTWAWTLLDERAHLRFLRAHLTAREWRMLQQGDGDHQRRACIC